MQDKKNSRNIILTLISIFSLVLIVSVIFSGYLYFTNKGSNSEDVSKNSSSNSKSSSGSYYSDSNVSQTVLDLEKCGVSIKSLLSKIHTEESSVSYKYWLGNEEPVGYGNNDIFITCYKSTTKDSYSISTKNSWSTDPENYPKISKTDLNKAFVMDDQTLKEIDENYIYAKSSRDPFIKKDLKNYYFILGERIYEISVYNPTLVFELSKLVTKE